MKAILVIDMPKSCKDCRLTYLDKGDDAYYGIHIRRCIFDDAEADANERYYDCPLKPMPSKSVWDNDFSDGWNACLKEIENESNTIG